MQTTGENAHYNASENTYSFNCPLSVAVNPYHLGILIFKSDGIFFFNPSLLYILC